MAAPAGGGLLAKRDDLYSTSGPLARLRRTRGGATQTETLKATSPRCEVTGPAAMAAAGFGSAVARNRAMDAQAIQDTEALIYTANEATSNELADKIGSLDDAIAVFAADPIGEGEKGMTHQLKSSEESLESVPKAEYDKAYAEGYAKGLKLGVAEERARYKEIIESDEGKKRPQAAMSAANHAGMSAEATIAFLAKLPEKQPMSRAEKAMRDTGYGSAKVIDFESAMNASRHPEVGAASGEVEPMSRAQRAMADAGFKPKGTAK